MERTKGQVLCALCNYHITQKETCIKYGMCEHQIHLRCFFERSLFVKLGSACVTCVRLGYRAKSANESSLHSEGECTDVESDTDGPKTNRSSLGPIVAREVKAPSIFPPNNHGDIVGFSKRVKQVQRNNPTTPLATSDESWFCVEENIRTEASKALQSAFSELCVLPSPGVGTGNSGVRQGGVYPRNVQTKAKPSNHVRLSEFIDQVNTEFSTIKFLNLPKEVVDHEVPIGKGKGGMLNPDYARSVTIPHQVGGERTWLPVETTAFREMGTKITNRVRIDPRELRANGFTAVHMLAIGVNIKHLVYGCKYELGELIGLGFTWDGILGLRMTINDFDDQQLSVENFLSFFPDMCLEDLLVMPPHNLTCEAKVAVTCQKINSVETACALGFSFLSMACFMGPTEVLSLSRKISVQDLVEKLGMQLQHMKRMRVVNKDFFRQAGWESEVGYFVEKLKMNKYEFDISESKLDVGCERERKIRSRGESDRKEVEDVFGIVTQIDNGIRVLDNEGVYNEKGSWEGERRREMDMDVKEYMHRMPLGDGPMGKSDIDYMGNRTMTGSHGEKHEDQFTSRYGQMYHSGYDKRNGWGQSNDRKSDVTFGGVFKAPPSKLYGRK